MSNARSSRISDAIGARELFTAPTFTPLLLVGMIHHLNDKADNTNVRTG